MKSLRTCGLSYLSRRRGGIENLAEKLPCFWPAGVRLLSLGGVLISLQISCSIERSERAPGKRAEGPAGRPPTTRTDRCAASTSRVEGDSNPLPGQVVDYCADPHADARIYGNGVSLPLRDACVDSFGERCGEQTSLGLERIVQQRYVAADLGSAALQVDLLRFAEAEGALSSFAALTIGDSEPSRVGLTSFVAGDRAALGDDVAFVVQGRHVVQVRYRDEQQTLQQRTHEAKIVLPAFLRALCTKLPPSAKLPEALLGLPVKDRVALGERYVARDVLDIEGAGPGAIGFYQRDGRRWRVLSIHHPDVDAAKDAALTLRKSAGWMPHKQTPYDSFKLTFPMSGTGLSVEWVITQQLNRVWGVGDEIEALDPALSDSALAQRRLSYTEKLELLGRLLHSVH